MQAQANVAQRDSSPQMQQLVMSPQPLPHLSQFLSSRLRQFPAQQSCEKVSHDFAQLPHVFGSFVRSRQPFPGQQVSVFAQAGPPSQVQTPFRQTLPFVQAGLQAEATQLPITQACPAAHARSQAPQWSGSLVVSKQPPFAVVEPGQQRSFPTQARPPLHEQRPETQLSPARQVMPQPPQFAVSLDVRTHCEPQQVSPAPHAPPPPQRHCPL